MIPPLRAIFAAAGAVVAIAAVLAAVPAAGASACTAPVGGACGAYVWAGWRGSNGYNTYVADQAVDVQPGSAGSITVSNPSNWSAVSRYTSCGGCVQTYTSVQQLTNNWGNGGWNGGSDTPLAALRELWITYRESSPASDPADQYEFSPDIWTNYAGHLCGGCGDVMMWADTSAQRCAAVHGWTVLGHPVLLGQDWTVYLGPSGAGDEIIFILDGTGGPGTCARQNAGTFHVWAALRWLSAHPGPSGFPAFTALTMSQLNTGWEITAGDGAGYRIFGLHYGTVVKS